MSVAALVVAIWAALFFGAEVGGLAENWFDSDRVPLWFGRILVFAVVLSLGSLVSWGLSKIVRMSVLNNLDRVAGCVFGLARGVLLVAVFVIVGRAIGFSNDDWWLDSTLIPHFDPVAEWVEEMAPKGLDAITPDKASEGLLTDVAEVFE